MDYSPSKTFAYSLIRQQFRVETIEMNCLAIQGNKLFYCRLNIHFPPHPTRLFQRAQNLLSCIPRGIFKLISVLLCFDFFSAFSPLEGKTFLSYCKHLRQINQLESLSLDPFLSLLDCDEANTKVRERERERRVFTIFFYRLHEENLQV